MMLRWPETRLAEIVSVLAAAAAGVEIPEIMTNVKKKLAKKRPQRKSVFRFDMVDPSSDGLKVTAVP